MHGRNQSSNSLLICRVILGFAASILLPSPLVLAKSPPATLTLDSAMTMAAQNNTQAVLAAEKTREARAKALSSASSLLPQISGDLSQKRKTSNRAASGVLTTPLLLGPYNVFDARIKIAQNIFDLSAIEGARAGQAGLKKKKLEEALAKDQARYQAGLAYLSLLKAQASERGAESDVEQAKSIFQLLRDQHWTGLVTAVDATRAEVQLAFANSFWIQSQTARQEAELQIKRAVVLSLDDEIVLVDKLKVPSASVPTLTQAIADAQQNRLELKVARAELQTKSLEHKAAWGEQLPSLAIDGDYGLSASRPNRNEESTYSVGVALNIPIFDGGKTAGSIGQTRSQKFQAAIIVKDTEIQVEQDVRLAHQLVTQSRAQLVSARKALELAQKELEQVRSQFKAGVGDSVALVAAESGLTQAREEYILALVGCQAARLSLSYAQGKIETFEL